MNAREAKFHRLFRSRTILWNDPQLWGKEYPLLSEAERRRVLNAALWTVERRGDDLPHCLCEHVRDALPKTEKPWTPKMNMAALALLQGKSQYQAAKEAKTSPQAIQNMRKRSSLFARIYEASVALSEYQKRPMPHKPAPLHLP